MILTRHHYRERGGLKLRDESFRRPVWGAIAAAAITVVGGAVQSNQAKVAANKAANAANGYKNVSLQDEQQAAIAGNLDAQGSIETLLGRSNQFQQGQALSLANQAMPGYSALAGSLTSRAQTMADHPYDVPKEVEDNLSRIAAEKGISGGTRGQFNDFSLLRDFGINQLDYGQKNISQSAQITSMLSSIAPKVNPMSPLAFYVSPSESAAAATNNNSNNQSIAQDNANNAAKVQQQGSADTWANLSKLAGAGVAAYQGRKTGGSTYKPATDADIYSATSANGL